MPNPAASAVLTPLPPPGETDVATLARRIASLGSHARTGIYHLSWWSDRVLQWAMSHEQFKTQLFRLVDTFPALGDDEARIADYLDQYLSGVDIPRLVDWGLSLSGRIPGGDHLSATVTRHNVERMARQFIAGANEAGATAKIAEMWEQGIAATVDLLGEHTCSDAEADAYAARARSLLRSLVAASATWPGNDRLEQDGRGRIPRVSLSIKVSALTAAFAPLSLDRAVDGAEARLASLAGEITGGSASIFLDMESYETKEIIHALLERLAADPIFDGAHLGIVVQAYLKDAVSDIERIARLSSERAIPLTVRLVKGAYWDTETVIAAAQGWPSVVFARKEQTDANFERCARLLLACNGTLRSAFASHNLRSLAYVLATAQGAGIPEVDYEIQLLYGMAEPVQAALGELGMRLRVYAPVGELVPGMSYLVRRLLENTSNESFVRHRFAEGQSLDALLAPADAGVLPGLPEITRRPASYAEDPGPYRPEPPMEWRRRAVREEMAEAVESFARRASRHIPVLIDGQSINADTTLDSVDPADPARTVATAAVATAGDVGRAVEAAHREAAVWGRTAPGERADILFRAARWMRARRYELAALEVFEVGKPWAEADGDVCEAIDYCEYYGREELRLSDDGRGRVESPPGEENRMVYEPRGVVAVIAPWNFPLAIPTGMTVAALAAGNTVVLKPAEQSPACAFALVEALQYAGLPPGALSFVPGDGEVTGTALVAHPEVDMIAFTGSRAVGLVINEIAARHVPGKKSITRVLAEMGGKNAIIVDADADLDEAVAAIIHSAFGYSGQKCSAASRVIALSGIYDRLAERLVGAAEALHIGHPRGIETQMGPLIEASAVERVARYRADPGGEILLARDDVPEVGFFAGPVIVGNVDPGAPLAQEEIFGPVLALMRARDMAGAIALANHTDYALTAGIVSRSPRHIREATAALRAGNVYVNRSITGAVVGRQPFGGSGLSGVGSKAGGPDYLVQFTNPKVVSENTMRHGFAPQGGGDVH